jgi:hypothetical protein
MSHHHVAIAAAVVMSMSAGNTALAAKKCDIVGKFTDSLGSTGAFKTEKKGTVSNAAICSAPYALKVTKLSKTIIDISGKSKDESCGALTGDFTFNDGGCTSASGTVTIAGLGSLPDTITKTGKAFHRPPADTSMLSNGLK